MIGPFAAARRDLILRHVLDAADPARAVRRAWDDSLWNRPTSMLAIGKAAPAMAREAIARLGVALREGLVIAPPGVGDAIPDPRVRTLTADHPLPTERSLAAGAAATAFLRGIPGGDILLVLLSGGGSALLCEPIAGLTLEDLRAVTAALQRSGADIRELNTVRKHLDATKAGHPGVIAGAAARVLVLSDVVGDPLDVIASGPMVADPTTFSDARRVMERRHLAPRFPAIMAAIARGESGAIPETPKPGEPRLTRHSHTIVANNAAAAEAAAAALRSLGMHVILRTEVEGPAADIGREMARWLLDARPRDRGHTTPAALVVGGEWVVDTGGASGRGGPSQELALAAAIDIDHNEAAQGTAGLLAFSTDGVDGPTDAAGACVDAASAGAMRRAGIDPHSALRLHDSTHALAAADALIRTGPTGTNVNHIAVAWTG